MQLRVASVPRETSTSTRRNVLQSTVIFLQISPSFSQISDEPDPESFCHGFGRFNYYRKISFQTYYANSACAARSPPTRAQTSCACIALVVASMDVASFLPGSCKPAPQAPQESHRSQGITAQCCWTVRHPDALLERTGGAHAPRRRLKALLFRSCVRRHGCENSTSF